MHGKTIVTKKHCSLQSPNAYSGITLPSLLYVQFPKSLNSMDILFSQTGIFLLMNWHG